MDAHPLHAVAVGGIMYALTQNTTTSVVVGGAVLLWMLKYGHTAGPFTNNDDSDPIPAYNKSCR